MVNTRPVVEWQNINVFAEKLGSLLEKFFVALASPAIVFDGAGLPPVAKSIYQQ